MYFNISALLVLLVVVADGAVVPIGLTPQLDGRIVGGRPTTISAHPWQVSLQRSGAHYCGGSIVSATIIVTAAHCLPVSVSAAVLKVRAGSSYRRFGGTLVLVAAFKTHEQYSSNTKAYDIAVLWLTSPLSSSSFVQPIALATTSPAHGSAATCTGWGTTAYKGTLSSQLLFIDLHIVGRTECASSRYGYGARVTGTMICAAADSKDACQGDSGGPLVSGGRLVGVVSWGTNCALANYPGVYADVAVLRSWVIKAASTMQ